MTAIKGTKYNDTLYGTDSADTISGLDGHDVLVSSYGADIMNGGAGYDSIDYGNSNEGVGANLMTGHGYGGTGEGDTLVGIERLYGSIYNDGFIGNAEYNELYGFDGNDYLDGGDFLDHLEGGSGADLLKGGGGDDFLDGGDGDDTLNGGPGADALVGGLGIDTADYGGADTYIVADLGGNPFIHPRGDAEGDTYSYVENLVGSIHADQLYGNDFSNVLSGGDGDDSLFGQGGVDTLYGGNGNDYLYADPVTIVPIHGFAGNALDVLTGIDTLVGGAGDDLYLVQDSGDVIIEYAGEGIDSVESGASFTMPANVEKLRLGGPGPMNGTGNGLDNALTGSEGFNILDGRAGADFMSGLAGDDWYFVDNALDYVREGAAGGAFDRVFASVDYVLAAGQEIERLSTTDNLGVAPLNFRGNELANTIYGNAGSNALKGMAGNDTLVGLGGIDAFVFNMPLDAVNNVDNIADFSVADDDIILASWTFTALPAGTLSAGAFHIGTGAADADDRVIYNSATGALLYDPDGIASGAAVPFATVGAGLALTNADFIIV